MRVLFLTDGIFPFQIGGMQKHSIILAKLLLQHKIHVHLVHCGGEGYTKEAFIQLFETNELEFLEETMVKFPKTDPFPGHYIRENKVYSKNIFLQLEDALEKYDLIYAQGFSGWRFIKEKHKKKYTLPILVNFHGLEMYQTAPNLRVKAAYSLFKNAVKWNLKNADYVYSFGGKIDTVIEELGVSANKVLNQSNGIKKEWLVENVSNSNAIRKFIFVGRAERRKGIEELNQALQVLIADELEFEFNFIGPIDQKLQIEDKRINYFGEIRDAKRIQEILQEQDCLVCPSHAEGMPTVILEAMASGLSIIGTNVGAVERQIRGNGILLEKPDIIDLTKAITTIIKCEDNTLLTFKQKSIELIASDFLWERVVEQKIADFKNVLALSLTI